MQKLYTLFIALAFIAFAPFVVHSQTPAVHIAARPAWISACKPFDKKPPLRAIQRGYFYDLVEEQINVEKESTYNHIIREIISETGIQNGSEISVGFDPVYERLEFHDITVWRDNKPQNRLSAQAFKVIADEQDLSNFIYQGTFSALCILKDIRKGDRIDYSYTVTGRNPIFGDKFSRTIYFQGSRHIAHQYTVLLASPQRQLTVKPFNDVPKVATSMVNGLKKYEWESFLVKPEEEDDTEPDWYNSYLRAQITEYQSWADVVNWAMSVNPPASNIKGQLATEIEKLKAKAGSDKEKYFRYAVKLVQDEVRYMGIEMGEYSHRANRPEKVFGQRYGDCKDKALLLASILRSGGIDANMVLVNSRIKGHIDEFNPSPVIFDHAVVTANVNGKQVWIDATISGQGGSGTDIYFPDYGKGLVLKPGNTGLTEIPLSKTGKISCEENYSIPNDTGKVKLYVKTTYTLNQADNIRSRIASTGMAEMEKNYLDYYAKLYPKTEAADSVSVKDDESTNTLVVTESYVITDFFKKDSVSGKYGAGFYANYIDDQLPNINSRIKTPVDVNFPYAIDYTIHVDMPQHWNITEAHTSVHRGAYRFDYDKSAQDKRLTLHYEFAYLRDNVPVNKLGEFMADINDLKNNKLSFSFNYSGGDDDESSSGPWPTILTGAVVLGVFFRIFRRARPRRNF